MPTYSLPQFNVLANVWTAELGSFQTRYTYKSPTRARDFQVQAQLYIQQRFSAAVGVMLLSTTTNVNTAYMMRIDLRVPKGTPLRYPIPNTTDGSSNFDVVEVPAGSGRFYFVVFVVPVHLGFPNEYLTAVLVPYTNVGAPEDATLELHDHLVLAFGTPF